MGKAYDVVVIGGGPGGYVAALRASQLGARVAVVEQGELGGVCLNVGCIPTKALLRSAEVYEMVTHARDFGVMVDGDVKADWAKMQDYKAKVVRRLVKGVAVLLKKAQVPVIEGRGRLVDAHTVEVQGAEGTQQVSASKIILATGSRPVKLPLPGFDLLGVVDATGALELESLPDRLLIVGCGVICAEFATLFSSLGVRVTVVEMLERALPMMDHDIAHEIHRSLKRRKCKVYFDSRAQRIDEHDGALLATFETPDGEKQIEVDKVLVTVGRWANIQDLGLEQVGVETKRNGIVVDERMETNVPGIYAVGDVTGAWWLAHVASHEGIVAAENACGHESRMHYKAVPSCVFSHPEAASVGLNEEQAREQGYDVLVGKSLFLSNGKAVTYGERDGFVKVIAEGKHGEILGVHIVGPHASDLILEAALAMQMEATLDEIAATIHPHPTLGEVISEAVLAARGQALQS